MKFVSSSGLSSGSNFGVQLSALRLCLPWLVLTVPILTALASTAPPPNAREHWGFQPPRLVSPPVVKEKRWAKTDVDRFILAKLEAVGVTPA
jgi:hypothetical protein